MYKPESARRWGYFALPVLHGDRLVGKVDAKADRKASTLVVRAIHQDVPFDADTRDAVLAELDDLAAWLGVERVGPRPRYRFVAATHSSSLRLAAPESIASAATVSFALNRSTIGFLTSAGSSARS
jgi:uncharacterized protein YcaQ